MFSNPAVHKYRIIQGNSGGKVIFSEATVSVIVRNKTSCKHVSKFWLVTEIQLFESKLQEHCEWFVCLFVFGRQPQWGF
jgi:hypothetical protein